MRRQVIYTCPTCGASKKIMQDPERMGRPVGAFPASVLCGWRGCPDQAKPAARQEPQNSANLKGENQ